MMALAKRAIEILQSKYEPHGFNVGFNQGRVAGAGVEHHIHMHVVPRWGGDTNFMPVIANHRVMPQSLEDSYRVLREAFGEEASNPG
jgi:ATP adenylyltransferase